jgi:hypothetical protein
LLNSVKLSQVFNFAGFFIILEYFDIKEMSSKI